MWGPPRGAGPTGHHRTALHLLEASEERENTMKERLETPRLILRRFAETDAADVYEYAKNPEVGPAAGWPVHTSVENSLEIIKTVLDIPGNYAVVEKATGKVIGSAGFTSRRRDEMGEHEDELGYALCQSRWGRGYMPEAVAELLRYGFEERGLTTVWCGYYEGNHKSRRVVEKSGFTFRFSRKVRDLLGEDRVELFYTLTKEDWEKRRGPQPS